MTRLFIDVDDDYIPITDNVIALFASSYQQTLLINRIKFQATLYRSSRDLIGRYLCPYYMNQQHNNSHDCTIFLSSLISTLSIYEEELEDTGVPRIVVLEISRRVLDSGTLSSPYRIKLSEHNITNVVSDEQHHSRLLLENAFNISQYSNIINTNEV